MAWIILAIGITGNVLSNVFFKQAMAGFPVETSFGSLLAFAFNPFLWLGGLSAVTMLVCYLFAIKDMDLANTYAAVTSLTLVGVTIASAIVFREVISLQSVIGTVLVIGGIFLISSAPDHIAEAAPQAVAERVVNGAS
jgi:multidrug transporter EmrE-like cation transporter